MDSVQWIVTPLAGRAVKQAEQKLKSSTLKDVVCSFCTAVPLTKLCTADQLVCKYLLYVLLDTTWRLNQRIDMPPTELFKQHSADSW